MSRHKAQAVRRHKPRISRFAAGVIGIVVIGIACYFIFGGSLPFSGTPFQLKAVFTNEKKTLWPGEFVSVKLLVEDARKAIVVPASAIQRGPDGAYVYLIDFAQKAEMRSVTVDLVQDGLAIVRSGLTAGEPVIVEGQFKLRPGSLVAPKEGERSVPAASRTPTPPRS